MTKQNAKKMVKGRKALPKRGKSKARGSVSATAALDGAAKRYAQLLNDPCYSNLTPPIYEGSGSGILTRFESDFIVNGTGTDTGAFIAFAPGSLGTAATIGGSVAGATGAITSDTGSIALQLTPARQPGVGLTPSMAAARCISACMQVSFVGSELARAGIVSVGQMVWNDLAGTISTSSLRALSSTVVRIPDGEVEIKLRPSSLSSKFVPVIGTNDSDLQSQPVLVATMAGIPTSTGMRVRLVAVYEWMPISASGVIVPETAASHSNNTLNQVINFLDNRVPGWSVRLLSAATKIAPAMLAFV